MKNARKKPAPTKTRPGHAARPVVRHITPDQSKPVSLAPMEIEDVVKTMFEVKKPPIVR